MRSRRFNGDGVPAAPGAIGFGMPDEMNWMDVDPGPDDPQVRGEAELSTRFQGCGGAWLADLVLD